VWATVDEIRENEAEMALEVVVPEMISEEPEKISKTEPALEEEIPLEPVAKDEFSTPAKDEFSTPAKEQKDRCYSQRNLNSALKSMSIEEVNLGCPKDYQLEIWEENKRFYLSRFIFSPEFIQFLLHLAESQCQTT
jgi:hypothetical protein